MLPNECPKSPIPPGTPPHFPPSPFGAADFPPFPPYTPTTSKKKEHAPDPVSLLSSADTAFEGRRRVILGVCAMDKKIRSAPMVEILDRLRAYGEFHVIIFGDELILDDTIDYREWPMVDCLISFFSSGFPLEKVIKYQKLRDPYCINDLVLQRLLLSRKSVYDILEVFRIPTPRHLYIIRNQNNELVSAGTGAEVPANLAHEAMITRPVLAPCMRAPAVPPKIVQTDDYIEIAGHRLYKPVVEKPIDSEDHNVHIYYGKSNGGGSRRLFRKIGNRSSRFYPKIEQLRSRGSYVYEEFILGGRDLKAYTIGPSYAHGEMRKSPVVDGIVDRDPDGKEYRIMTKLNTSEKAIAGKVVMAFQQNICGLDIIRQGSQSYVIDVNGWSFVKGNLRYYDKCARILRKMCLNSPKGRASIGMRLQNQIPRVALSMSNRLITYSREDVARVLLTGAPEPLRAVFLALLKRYPTLRRTSVVCLYSYLLLQWQHLTRTHPADKLLETHQLDPVLPLLVPRTAVAIELRAPSPAPAAEGAPEDPILAWQRSSEGVAGPFMLAAEADLNISVSQTDQNYVYDVENGRMLRAVVAVFRHADRTPKQKVKFNMSYMHAIMELFGPPDASLVAALAALAHARTLVCRRPGVASIARAVASLASPGLAADWSWEWAWDEHWGWLREQLGEWDGSVVSALQELVYRAVGSPLAALHESDTCSSPTHTEPAPAPSWTASASVAPAPDFTSVGGSSRCGCASPCVCEVPCEGSDVHGDAEGHRAADADADSRPYGTEDGHRVVESHAGDLVSESAPTPAFATPWRLADVVSGDFRGLALPRAAPALTGLGSRSVQFPHTHAAPVRRRAASSARADDKETAVPRHLRFQHAQEPSPDAEAEPDADADAAPTPVLTPAASSASCSSARASVCRCTTCALLDVAPREWFADLQDVPPAPPPEAIAPPEACDLQRSFLTALHTEAARIRANILKKFKPIKFRKRHELDRVRLRLHRDLVSVHRAVLVPLYRWLGVNPCPEHGCQLRPDGLQRVLHAGDFSLIDQAFTRPASAATEPSARPPVFSDYLDDCPTCTPRINLLLLAAHDGALSPRLHALLDDLPAKYTPLARDIVAGWIQFHLRRQCGLPHPEPQPGAQPLFDLCSQASVTDADADAASQHSHSHESTSSSSSSSPGPADGFLAALHRALYATVTAPAWIDKAGPNVEPYPHGIPDEVRLPEPAPAPAQPQLPLAAAPPCACCVGLPFEELRDSAVGPSHQLSRLMPIDAVLEEMPEGVKLQLKPTAVTRTGALASFQIVCKWGGGMTHAGWLQARQYAHAFWNDICPPPVPLSEFMTSIKEDDNGNLIAWDRGIDDARDAAMGASPDEPPQSRSSRRASLADALPEAPAVPAPGSAPISREPLMLLPTGSAFELKDAENPLLDRLTDEWLGSILQYARKNTLLPDERCRKSELSVEEFHRKDFARVELPSPRLRLSRAPSGGTCGSSVSLSLSRPENTTLSQLSPVVSASTTPVPPEPSPTHSARDRDNASDLADAFPAPLSPARSQGGSPALDSTKADTDDDSHDRHFNTYDINATITEQSEHAQSYMSAILSRRQEPGSARPVPWLEDLLHEDEPAPDIHMSTLPLDERVHAKAHWEVLQSVHRDRKEEDDYAFASVGYQRAAADEQRLSGPEADLLNRSAPSLLLLEDPSLSRAGSNASAHASTGFLSVCPSPRPQPSPTSVSATGSFPFSSPPKPLTPYSSAPAVMHTPAQGAAAAGGFGATNLRLSTSAVTPTPTSTPAQPQAPAAVRKRMLGAAHSHSRSGPSLLSLFSEPPADEPDEAAELADSEADVVGQGSMALPAAPGVIVEEVLADALTEPLEPVAEVFPATTPLPADADGSSPVPAPACDFPAAVLQPPLPLPSPLPEAFTPAYLETLRGQIHRAVTSMLCQRALEEVVADQVSEFPPVEDRVHFFCFSPLPEMCQPLTMSLAIPRVVAAALPPLPTRFLHPSQDSYFSPHIDPREVVDMTAPTPASAIVERVSTNEYSSKLVRWWNREYLECLQTAYERQMINFLSTMQVYCSDEPRVSASARAFFMSTLSFVTKEIAAPRHCNFTRECDALVELRLLSHKGVQEYLDDTSEAVVDMNRAKAVVESMLQSKIQWTEEQVSRFMTYTELMSSCPQQRDALHALKDAHLHHASAEAEALQQEQSQLALLQREQEEVEEQCARELDEESAQAISEEGINADLRRLKKTHKQIEAKIEESRVRMAAQRSPAVPVPPSLRMTAWAARCLRWLGVPREQLRNLYKLLLDLQHRIHRMTRFNALVDSACNCCCWEDSVLKLDPSHPVYAHALEQAHAIHAHAHPYQSMGVPAPSAAEAALARAPLQLPLRDAPHPKSLPGDPAEDCPAMSAEPALCVPIPDSVLPLWLAGSLPHPTLGRDWAVVLAAAPHKGMTFTTYKLVQLSGFADIKAFVKHLRELGVYINRKDSECPVCLDDTKSHGPIRAVRRPLAHLHLHSNAHHTYGAQHVPLAKDKLDALLQATRELPARGWSDDPSACECVCICHYPRPQRPCHGESFRLMQQRWDKLTEEFYNPVEDKFDPTKIPDVYDAVRYDVLHNSGLLGQLRPLYSASKKLADFVVPNEYGLLSRDKQRIGSLITRKLLSRIANHLEAAAAGTPDTPRVNLYFSSESHIHALRNTMLLGGMPDNTTMATTLEALELNYLSHGVWRLFEDTSAPAQSADRFYVNFMFSPGASLDPFVFTEIGHLLPVSRPIPITARIPLREFVQRFGNMQPPEVNHATGTPFVFGDSPQAKQ